jgi:hypothetical protein
MPRLASLWLSISCCLGGVVAQADAPWLTRLRTLPAQQAPAEPPDPAALLRPELAFQPGRRWVYFAALAKELATEEVPAAELKAALEAGGKAVREALAVEKADKDLGAVTALFVVQMWQWATGKELGEAQTDAVHAQVVQALTGPEVAAMRDVDKQRCWELCVGYTTWFAALFEAASEDAQRQALQRAAAERFAQVVGIAPGELRPTTRGLALRKSSKAQAGNPAPANPAAPPHEGGKPVAATPAPAAPTPAKAAAKWPSGASPLPSSGPAIAGVTWTPPAGWTVEAKGGSTVYRATLRDLDDAGRPSVHGESAHQAAIGFLPVQTATAGPSALFERLWREQFAAFAPSEMHLHFRGRLPSKLVVLYMGRFHRRPDAPPTMGYPQTYGALWLVDLGADRFQPIVAVVEPRDPRLGMDEFKELAALQALAAPLGKVLDSVQQKDGKPPYPAGGYFAAADLLGEWEQSDSAFGGSYYNTATGGFAGVAVTASSGGFALRPDGTYDYTFDFYALNPQTGNTGGSSRHRGTYRLDGDVVLVQPSSPIPYEFTCCAVGIGRVVTSQGERRVLATVAKDRNGNFLQMPLIPNGTARSATLTMYVEKAK